MKRSLSCLQLKLDLQLKLGLQLKLEKKKTVSFSDLTTIFWFHPTSSVESKTIDTCPIELMNPIETCLPGSVNRSDGVGRSACLCRSEGVGRSDCLCRSEGVGRSDCLCRSEGVGRSASIPLHLSSDREGSSASIDSFPISKDIPFHSASIDSFSISKDIPFHSLFSSRSVDSFSSKDILFPFEVHQCIYKFLEKDAEFLCGICNKKETFLYNLTPKHIYELIAPYECTLCNARIHNECYIQKETVQCCRLS